MKYEQFLADVVQALAEVDFMRRTLSRVKSVLSATHDLVEKNGRLEKENAELRDELDDWKGNAEGFQPDAYMKLPVDADGIAIRPGDKIYFCGDPEGFALKCIAVGWPPCPVEFVDWEETGTTAWEEGSAFTHRQPKPLLLGVDGVPLEMGDTVYCDDDPEPLKVISLHAGNASYCTVGLEDSVGIILSADAPRLSHKKPEPADSWEKLKEDTKKQSCSYFGLDLPPALCDDCPHGSRQTGRACWQNARLDMIACAKRLVGIEEEARND